MELGAPELIIILIVVIVLFGVGRVRQLGGELGRAIHEFRRGLREGKEPTEEAARSHEMSGDESLRKP